MIPERLERRGEDQTVAGDLVRGPDARATAAIAHVAREPHPRVAVRECDTAGGIT